MRKFFLIVVGMTLLASLAACTKYVEVAAPATATPAAPTPVVQACLDGVLSAHHANLAVAALDQVQVAPSAASTFLRTASIEMGLSGDAMAADPAIDAALHEAGSYYSLAADAIDTGDLKAASSFMLLGNDAISRASAALKITTVPLCTSVTA